MADTSDLPVFGQTTHSTHMCPTMRPVGVAPPMLRMDRSVHLLLFSDIYLPLPAKLCCCAAVVSSRQQARMRQPSRPPAQCAPSARFPRRCTACCRLCPPAGRPRRRIRRQRIAHHPEASLDPLDTSRTTCRGHIAPKNGGSAFCWVLGAGCLPHTTRPCQIPCHSVLDHAAVQNQAAIPRCVRTCAKGHPGACLCRVQPVRGVPVAVARRAHAVPWGIRRPQQHLEPLPAPPGAPRAGLPGDWEAAFLLHRCAASTAARPPVRAHGARRCLHRSGMLQRTLG